MGWLLLATFLFLFQACLSQNVDDIIKKCIVAHGYDKLESLKTVTLEGTAKTLKEDLALKMFFKAPDKIRSEMEFNKVKLIQAFNGDIGWYLPPTAMSDMVYDMPDEMILKMKTETGFLSSPLINYKNKGSIISFIGMENLDGKPAFKLKYLAKTGLSLIMFIDSTTYLHVKSYSETFNRGQITKVETIYGKYEKNKDISLPKSITTLIDNKKVSELIFNKIEFNKDLPDSLFDKPKLKQSH